MKCEGYDGKWPWRIWSSIQHLLGGAETNPATPKRKQKSCVLTAGGEWDRDWEGDYALGWRQTDWVQWTLWLRATVTHVKICSAWHWEWRWIARSLSAVALPHWRWKLAVPPKRLCILTKPDGVLGHTELPLKQTGKMKFMSASWVVE